MNLLFHPLTLVTFSPLIGVLVLLFLKPEQKNIQRWVALITSLITLGISILVLVLFVQYDAFNPGDLHMIIDAPWIQVAGWNISYAMGIDGLDGIVVIKGSDMGVWGKVRLSEA